MFFGGGDVFGCGGGVSGKKFFLESLRCNQLWTIRYERGYRPVLNLIRVPVADPSSETSVSWVHSQRCLLLVSFLR
jgi:hypothetical protein